MDFFFFFQAEDGIRDLIVTGVQTCALFFSSRRRHTRSDRDWSSDVCSSDLTSELQLQAEDGIRDLIVTGVQTLDRKSVGKGKRVDIVGRRIINNNKTTTRTEMSDQGVRV